MIPQCQTCRFFEPDPRGNFFTWGECRRAPIVARVLIEMKGEYHGDEFPKREWPRVQNADSCGDYEAKL